MPPRPSNTASQLGGVDLFYDRRSSADLGKGVRTTLAMTQNFEDKLDACFKELWQLCPLGTADKIFTAGAWVDKPGQHGQGRAFDLDGFEWTSRKFIVLEDGARNGDRKFYFGIDAVLRKHFGVVLNYLYNTDHHDHFHIDDGSPIDFDTSSRSKVLFLQGSLVFVFGLSVGPTGIDGQWGDKTKNAVNQVLTRLGISGNIFTKSVWLSFLTETAKEGLGATGGGVITPRNITITQPTPDSEHSFGQPVHFAGTADAEVKTIKLIAEDKFHFDTATVTGEKWSTDYSFSQAGSREIVVKGFDSSNRQVSRETLGIVLKITEFTEAIFPESSNNLLGSIPDILKDAAQSEQVTQIFQGAKAIFKLIGGEIYIDSTAYVSANGSPNVSLLDPIHGILQTNLKYPDRDGQEQFVNSEKIPYFLLPEGIYEPFGIQLGDIAVFISKNKIAYAVFADVGESHKSIGASIALAEELGQEAIVDNLVNRGISENIISIIFPNSGDGTPQTPEQVRKKGEQLFKQLGGNPPL